MHTADSETREQWQAAFITGPKEIKALVWLCQRFVGARWHGGKGDPIAFFAARHRIMKVFPQ